MNKEKIITSICLSFLFLMLCSIIPHKIYTAKHEEASDIVETNWGKLYPFSDTNNKIEEQNSNNNNIIKKIVNKLNGLYKENNYNIYKTYLGCIKKVESKIENAFNENIFYRTNLIELNGRISKITNQKYIAGRDKVVNMKDDYLVFLENENDMTDEANQLINFSKYLNNNNIDLLYVQAPDKVNKFYEEQLINGYKDYSNDNADNFISIVKQANIDVLDLRDKINEKYSDEEYFRLFFKTDNHWLPSTCATQVISNHLKNNYKFNINIKAYDIENYNVETHEKIVLGALGRRATLGYSQLEDFKIYYPKFKTNFKVNIPSIGIEKSGNFYSTLINQKKLNPKDHYKDDVYGSYGYGGQAIVKIDNLNITKGKKILMIKDSFAETVYPFLSIEMNKLDIIDLRHFTGSLQTYINKNKPDMVIVMYNPSSLANENVSTEHTNTFDFN